MFNSGFYAFKSSRVISFAGYSSLSSIAVDKPLSVSNIGP